MGGEKKQTNSQTSPEPAPVAQMFVSATSKQEQGREVRAASLAPKIRPEGPEDNLREQT